MENNDKWLTIFYCAKIISDLKPWKKFNDIDFFELRQYKIDRVYVSFLGRAKQVYGVVFYRGDEIVGVDIMSIRESIPNIQTGTMLNYKVVNPEEDDTQVYVNEFVKFINEFGLPQMCVVRDSEACFALSYIAYQFGIQLSTHEELFIIDEFVDGIEEFHNKPFSKLS